MRIIMLFINRHSFLLTGVLSVVLAGMLSAVLGLPLTSLILVIAVVVILFALSFYRMGAGGSSLTHSKPVLELIGNGHPVLLEFQSAY
jgi:hypothetical protein